MIGIKACNAFYLTIVTEARAIFKGDNSGGKRSQINVSVAERRTHSH